MPSWFSAYCGCVNPESAHSEGVFGFLRDVFVGWSLRAAVAWRRGEGAPMLVASSNLVFCALFRGLRAVNTLCASGGLELEKAVAACAGSEV